MYDLRIKAIVPPELMEQPLPVPLPAPGLVSDRGLSPSSSPHRTSSTEGDASLAGGGGSWLFSSPIVSNLMSYLPPSASTFGQDYTVDGGADDKEINNINVINDKDRGSVDLSGDNEQQREEQRRWSSDSADRGDMRHPSHQYVSTEPSLLQSIDAGMPKNAVRVSSPRPPLTLTGSATSSPARATPLGGIQEDDKGERGDKGEKANSKLSLVEAKLAKLREARAK